MPVDKETRAELKHYKVSNDNCNYAMALVIAQLKNALQGDTKAFTAIRDIIGEKPKDNEQEEIERDNQIIINVIPASEADIEKDD